MGGKVRQRRDSNLVDSPPSHRWRVECRDLALRLGFEESEIWKQWVFCALARQFEQKYPQNVAELLAFADVKALFDKRGEASPS